MIYRFGEHTLDTEGIELRAGSAAVALEPQAFLLLQFLIENRQRVVSKDEIIEAVWDGRVVSDSALTYAINTVRKSVGDDGRAQAVIKTFPRRGFRFIADLTDGGTPDPASTRTAPRSVSDKPSIAVLPFNNLSGDPEQEYFSDGISEDLITELSRFRWFFVIARNSSFSYKGQSPDIRRVAEELGVRYVVEGSVRRAGERVRISAQLVDGETGNQLWAERYDRDLTDIFAVQDEITQAITGAVTPSFASAEAHRADRKAPENFDAWDYAMRGNWHLWRMGKDEVAEARRSFESALGLDPKSVVALSGLAMCAAWQVTFGWAEPMDSATAHGYQAAQRAVELDDQDAWAHAALGFVNFLTREHDEAESACLRAIDLNPNLVLAEAVLSLIYAWANRYDDAVLHVEKAQRLSPRDSTHGMWSMAQAAAEYQAGNYEPAVACAKAIIAAMPKFPAAWRYLAASYAKLDRIGEAEAAIQQLLQILPNDSLKQARTLVPGADQKCREHFFDGLQKAGLPEG